MMWLLATATVGQRATASDLPLASSVSATAIVTAVEPKDLLTAPIQPIHYESRWVLTDSVTGTEEFRVSRDDAVGPGVHRVWPGFSLPMASVTVYLDVAVAPIGSGLEVGRTLLAIPLHPVSPDATKWEGAFCVRETTPPIVLQLRSRIAGTDEWGRPLGVFGPGTTVFDEKRQGMTPGEDTRNTVTVNTAPEEPSLVAKGPLVPVSPARGLVPLWAAAANRLTSVEARRRQAVTTLVQSAGKQLVCAAHSMRLFLRGSVSVDEGAALCRSHGWKPLGLFRRSRPKTEQWYNVLLAEGQTLREQLEIAGKTPGIARAEPDTSAVVN